MMLMMSLPTAKKMVTLKNTADIEAFLLKKTVRKILKLLQRMAVLASMEGYSNFTSILHLQI
jgi:hypothetical protein